MPVREVGGVGINECPKCNGLWVPDDKFEGLVNRAVESRRLAQQSAGPGNAPRVKGANPAQQGVQYRKCPQCDGFMSRRNFRKTSGVIIDVCTEHGTWLDADEIERIVGFIMTGGRPEASRFLENLESKSAESATTRVGGSLAMNQTGPIRVFETPNNSNHRLARTLLGVFMKILE
jgi:Zn-finger nucleic acid-binding protein